MVERGLFTLDDLQDALIDAIKEETGSELINPNDPQKSRGRAGLLESWAIKLDQVESATMALAGNYWRWERPKGATLVWYDRDHMGAILDELADRTSGQQPRDSNLVRLGVNPKIVDLTERILFGEITPMQVIYRR